MSPVNYRGRRRLDPDRPVERLRGLLADDAAALDDDGTLRSRASHQETTVQLPSVDGDPLESRPEDSVTGLDLPNSAEEEAWRTPVRWRLPWGVVLLAGLAVVAVLVTVLWPNGPAAGEQPITVGVENPTELQSPSVSVSSPGPQAPAAGGQTRDPTARLTVHVVGEVARPGVVEVAADARVGDAVEAAGGLGPHAVVDGVNLAAPVTDGSQVRIPDAAVAERLAASGESAVIHPEGAAPAGSAGPDGWQPAAGPAAGSTTGSTAGSQGQAGTGGPGGRVNLNTADAAELETLPRVGPVMAQRIVEHRQQVGGFRSVGELDDVTGIGPAMMAALEPLVTV